MATCQRRKALRPSRLYPGHGAPIDAVEARLTWLINHRLAREDAILKVLDGNPLSLSDITARVYTDVPPRILPAAARNVFAHLIDLVERNRVQALPELSILALFRLA